MKMLPWKEELYHHGIMGMRWGKRNGPPYPLAPNKHSASERKAGWQNSLSKNSPSAPAGGGGGGGAPEEDEEKDKEILDRLYKNLEETAAKNGLTPLEYLTNRNWWNTLSDFTNANTDEMTTEQINRLKNKAINHYSKTSGEGMKAERDLDTSTKRRVEKPETIVINNKEYLTDWTGVYEKNNDGSKGDRISNAKWESITSGKDALTSSRNLIKNERDVVREMDDVKERAEAIERNKNNIELQKARSKMYEDLIEKTSDEALKKDYSEEKRKTDEWIKTLETKEEVSSDVKSLVNDLLKG